MHARANECLTTPLIKYSSLGISHLGKIALAVGIGNIIRHHSPVASNLQFLCLNGSHMKTNQLNE